MENLSRNIENQEVKSVDKSDFNGEKYEQNIMVTQKERAENKKTEWACNSWFDN